MIDVLSRIFMDLGFAFEFAKALATGTMIVLLLTISILMYYLLKAPLQKLLSAWASRTKSSWDDFLIKTNISQTVALILPGLMLYFFLPVILKDVPELLKMLTTIVTLYLIVLVLIVVDKILSSLVQAYRSHGGSKQISISGFAQIMKLILFIIGGIIIIATVLDKSPLVLISGLGAFTAILLLVFKDSIMGFVAGIQLVTNDMVSIGDWIEMPRYGADGTVLDITLATVKVQNWDKTISTIPTYALISESFKNWRGMEESGGRRVKRAILIDLKTIKFCSTEMLDRFEKIQLISTYIQQKRSEIGNTNQQIKIDAKVNQRRLTNMGTYRAYIERYLKNLGKINMDMTFLIRHLSPTDHGIPIEIYLFTKEQDWNRYEAIQADIFDHLLAIVKEFDLEVFQVPTGTDFQSLIR